MNTTKKLISMLLFLSILTFLPTSALTFQYGQFTYITNSDTTVRLAYRGMMNPYHVTGHLEIPSEVYYDGNAYTVNEISDNAFANNGITSLVIPGTVKRIGINTFYRCPLTELILEEGVQLIDGGAFAGCQQLTSLTLPSSITTICDVAFSGCQSLKSVYIKGATDIGATSFQYCSALEKVILGKEVRKITYRAFPNCPKITEVIIEDGDTPLTCSNDSFVDAPISNMYIGRSLTSEIPSHHKNTLESVTIGPRVTYIVAGMFSNCKKLTNVVIPNSVTTIHNYAFEDCTGLKELVIGDGVETIGRSAFSGCTALSSLTMGKNIITINEWAFHNCSSLRSSDLQFGDSLKFIYAYAFSNCTGLTEFTIPSSVERVGARVFRGCTHLKKVIIKDSSKTLCMDSNASFQETTEFEGCPLKEVYQGRNMGCDWYDLENEDYIIDVDETPFGGFRSIKKVTISDRVTWIPAWYYASTGIYTVVIPNSVRRIMDEAFAGCQNLKAVVLGNGLTNIEVCAFSSGSLMAVYSMSTVPPTLGYDSFYSTTTAYGTLYIPTGSKEKYKTADGWKEFKNIVEISDAEFNEAIDHLDEMYGYVEGDANGDREVNISDVNTIVDAILDGKQEINYDMNDDFEINIADINAVINMILSGE